MVSMQTGHSKRSLMYSSVIEFEFGFGFEFRFVLDVAILIFDGLVSRSGSQPFVFLLALGMIVQTDLILQRFRMKKRVRGC